LALVSFNTRNKEKTNNEGKRRSRRVQESNTPDVSRNFLRENHTFAIQASVGFAKQREDRVRKPLLLVRLEKHQARKKKKEKKNTPIGEGSSGRVPRHSAARKRGWRRGECGRKKSDLNCSLIQRKKTVAGMLAKRGGKARCPVHFTASLTIL